MVDGRIQRGVSYAKMTIDSRWLAVLKKMSPQSFTETCSFRPETGIIDGMPCLMVGSHVTQWADLLNRNFGYRINRYFKLGCRRVVICWDDYSFVSSAKSITQANRSKNAAPFVFGAGESLPSQVPVDYNEKIRNRNFKRKVIDFLATHLPHAVSLEGGRELVIDYVHAPIRYYWDDDKGAVCHEALQLPPVGEADVKYSRHIEGPAVVDSVDGDFIPISLIHHQMRLSAGASPEVAIYRLEYKLDKASGKRSAGGGAKKASRTWEYVHIPSLYEALQSEFERMMRPGLSRGTPLPADCFVHIFALCVGLTGTDFSRSLPHVTPEKMWESMSHKSVWNGLARSYDVDRRRLDVDTACDAFIAELYKRKFVKYTSGNTLQKVMQNLQASKLSATTRSQLPTPERVATTVRNVNFLLIYWQCKPPVMRDPQLGGDVWDYSTCFPETTEEFGFKRRNGGAGAVTWLDDDPNEG